MRFFLKRKQKRPHQRLIDMTSVLVLRGVSEMLRYVLVTAAFMSVLALSCSAWGLGTEDFGNKPLAEANYKEWKGIMPVVNDKARVYSNWVNGNEHFYYTGKAKELNAALE